MAVEFYCVLLTRILSLSIAIVLGACPDTDAPLLLPEVPVQDILYLVSFIYRGQVDVHQQHIASFLRTAKHLHVLGLEEGDRVCISETVCPSVSL